MNLILNKVRNIAIFAMTSSLLGCSQIDVDTHMAELCQKDGGENVFEKITLPNDQFDQYGDPIFSVTWSPQKKLYIFSSKSGEYVYFTRSELIKLSTNYLDIYEGTHAFLQKLTLTVTRKADNKIIGIYVKYLRAGGVNIPVLGLVSEKVCPSKASDKVFLRKIFVQAANSG